MDRRVSPKLTKAITALLATTAVIDMTPYASGVIFIPAGSALTTLTFHAAPTLETNGTYLPLHDSAGTPIVMTVAAEKCYQLPAACYGAQGIKIVGNDAGSINLALIG